MVSGQCITDVSGIRVGHYTDTVGATGCTVILAPRRGAVAGCEVRGGAAATRGLDALSPLNLVERAHAIVLTGGSSFGLECIAGVMEYLEERRVGFDVGVTRVPIVAGAVIFDLSIGDQRARPGLLAGRGACEAASDQPSPQGNVGAGTGATVAKLFGIERAMKGGLGCASVSAAGGLVVGALAVVNAVGDVRDWRTGKLLATPRGARSSIDSMKRGYVRKRFGRAAQREAITNTTLAVVATNARLTKVEATRVAQMAHDGFALAISPVHTMFDGDTTFALSVGKVKADVNLVGALAVESVAEAIVNAIVHARTLHGIPEHRKKSLHYSIEKTAE